MDEIGLAVKSQLETAYDIPFHVENDNEYRDRGYKLWPVNDLGELFEVKMLYRQGIRLIIEVYPQKYAAGMLNDMQNADDNKIKIFLKYIELMKEKRAKIELSLNNNLSRDITPELWTKPWKNMKLRVSVIPEDVENHEKNLFIDWSELVTGAMLSLLNIEKTEEKFLEGGVTQVLTNRYERNPVNRKLCLIANGYICRICGFDFEATYGEIGHHFIHVHHIEKISLHDDEYYISPEKDLIPVCANCHAMLHRVNPPMKPEMLREIISNTRNDGKGK